MKEKEIVNKTNLKPHKLHIEAIKYVKAQSQAQALKKIEVNLTEKEKEIVRRGRNQKSHTAPKNADIIDYKYATGFEALIGYLYLTNQEKRIKELVEMIIPTRPER